MRQPYSTGGVYVNYLGGEADEGTDRVKAAYGGKVPAARRVEEQIRPRQPISAQSEY